LAIHHDGELLVTAARLPFFSNEGYVYRSTANKDLCGPWSVDLNHPN